MRYTLLIAPIFLLLVSVIVADELPPAKGAPVPMSQVDKQSYAIGVSFATQLKGDEVELNHDMLIKGLLDVLTGKPQSLTEAQRREALQVLNRTMQMRAQNAAKTAAEKNFREGQAFLAKNKTQPGVVTTKTGLQYKVLKSGNGATPKATDTVNTHYHGTLLDGTVFDSTIQSGEPFPADVNGVIAGWTEALQLMKVGDKWQLFIPSELAYGKRGAGADIGPNAVLIFELEVLGIK